MNEVTPAAKRIAEKIILEDEIVKAVNEPSVASKISTRFRNAFMRIFSTDNEVANDS